ncbi:MAG: hypothetical protein IPP32_07885 [Bacteroidetes bacterium]|nr:hypothetical protein [Bacteroidota bacterium]
MRATAIYFSFPAAFYKLELFTPAIYANSIYIASLGDLLIHCLLIFCVAHSFYKRVNFKRAAISFGNTFNTLIPPLLLAFLFFFGWYIIQLNISIIRDSKIPFNIDNLLSLNGYSYIAFCSIGLLLMSFFLVADKIATSIFFFKYSRVTGIISAVLPLAGYITYAHFNGGKDLLITLWFVPALALIFYGRSMRKVMYSFSQTIILLLLFQQVPTMSFIKNSEEKNTTIESFLPKIFQKKKTPLLNFYFQILKRKSPTIRKSPPCLCIPTKAIAPFKNHSAKIILPVIGKNTI